MIRSGGDGAATGYHPLLPWAHGQGIDGAALPADLECHHLVTSEWGNFEVRLLRLLPSAAPAAVRLRLRPYLLPCSCCACRAC